MEATFCQTDVWLTAASSEIVCRRRFGAAAVRSAANSLAACERECQTGAVGRPVAAYVCDLLSPTDAAAPPPPLMTSRNNRLV